MENDLFSKLKEKMPKMSKGHKAISAYILEHYDKAAFMTAQKLGNAVGVSESTVVRFASDLGFEGYPDLQRSLQELMRNRLTAIQRIEVTSDRIGEDDVLDRVINLDIDKLRRTLEQTSREAFSSAVKSITNAKTIYILGTRSAASLASFLNYYLNLIYPQVKLVRSTTTSEMFEQILRIDENDVMIGISFPRYSKQTVKALKYAHESGAHVIAITDSAKSPIAQYADDLLSARSDMASFVDSLVAPLSLINALIVAVSVSNKETVSKSFERLEKIWSDYDVYEKGEDETNGTF